MTQKLEQDFGNILVSEGIYPFNVNHVAYICVSKMTEYKRYIIYKLENYGTHQERKS